MNYLILSYRHNEVPAEMPLGHASRGEDKESRMELGLSETIASHFCASARRLLVASKTLGMLVTSRTARLVLDAWLDATRW
jgi:hypothetical protein